MEEGERESIYAPDNWERQMPRNIGGSKGEVTGIIDTQNKENCGLNFLPELHASIRYQKLSRSTCTIDTDPYRNGKMTKYYEDSTEELSKSHSTGLEIKPETAASVNVKDSDTFTNVGMIDMLASAGKHNLTNLGSDNLHALVQSQNSSSSCDNSDTCQTVKKIHCELSGIKGLISEPSPLGNLNNQPLKAAVSVNLKNSDSFTGISKTDMLDNAENPNLGNLDGGKNMFPELIYKKQDVIPEINPSSLMESQNSGNSSGNIDDNLGVIPFCQCGYSDETSKSPALDKKSNNPTIATALVNLNNSRRFTGTSKTAMHLSPDNQNRCNREPTHTNNVDIQNTNPNKAAKHNNLFKINPGIAALLCDSDSSDNENGYQEQTRLQAIPFED